MEQLSDKKYINRFLCKISQEIEFDMYGLAVRDYYWGQNPLFLSESDFCDQIEKALIISESGMGKSSLLKNLKNNYLNGKSELFKLSQYKNTPSELREKINEFKKMQQSNSDVKPFILLDALDEAEDILGEITRYLSQDIKQDEIRLIITSKTRNNIVGLIEGLELKDNIYKLTPPSYKDVEWYVKEHGENPEEFFKAIDSKSVMSMCTNPLGLEFLLQSYKKEGFPEKTIADIWRDGINHLCEKNNQTSDYIPQNEMDCACWIAMIMALSDKSFVYSGIEANATEDSVCFSDLVCNDYSVPLLKETIENTALFSHDTLNNKSSFSHTTYFEHCAAVGIKRFLNKLNWDAVLRQGNNEFFRRFSGIVSRLALIDDEYRKDVLEIQPELLLQFKDCVDFIGPETLCEKIIEYYDKEPEKYIAHRFEEYSNFRNLEDKGNKVCEFLINTVRSKNTMNSSKLELIIDIARDSSCHYFADILVDIAIGKIQPIENIYNVKKSALHAMTFLNNDEAKIRLKEEFDLSKEDDSYDELKGYYLRNLWPKYLPTSEMTQWLKPTKVKNFSGGYSYFLSYFLPKKLGEISSDTESIIELLRWSMNLLQDKEDWHSHVRAAKLVYSWCWRFTKYDAIANLLADGYLFALEEHRCPFPQKDVFWKSEKYYLSPEKFKQDRDARFKVLLFCFQKNDNKKSGIYSIENFLSHSYCNIYSLFCIEDAQHLLYKLINEKEEKTRKLWKNCIKILLPRINLDDYQNDIYKLSQLDPEFIEELRNLKAEFKKEAKKRKDLENSEEERKKNQERELLEHEEKIREVLNKPVYDWGSFEWIVYSIGWIEQESGNEHSEFDISKSEFWKNLNKSEQKKLLEIARDFLINKERYQDRDTVFWMPSNALCLLHYQANELFETLSKDVWDKFADDIVRFAYDEEVKPIIRKLSSFEDVFENSIIRIMKKQVEAFSIYSIGEFLSRKTVERIMDEFQDLDEYRFHNILCDLVRYTKHKDAVNEFVEKNYADIKINKRYSYLFLMLALNPEKGSEVIQKIKLYNEECKKLLEAIIDQYQCKEIDFDLPVNLLAQFYIWLNNNYPANKKPYHEGVFSSSGIDKIYKLKEQIIGVLQKSDSPESLTAIEEIKEAFPNENYSYVYYKSSKNVQEAKFQPLNVDSIKELCDTRKSSIGFIIQTEKNLLEAVVKLLGEYQKHLLKERYYNVRYLWNYKKDRFKKIIDCYPKCEEYFSNHLAQFIKDKIEMEFYTIVLNQEVKIAPKDIPDFLIQLVKPNETPLELMVEVKCNWHPKVMTAIEQQLVEKYVKKSNTKIGLYVVAWFESEVWKNKDKHKKSKIKKFFPNGIEDARELFERQAKEQKINNGFDIRTIVIDCSLNADLA